MMDHPKQFNKTFATILLVLVLGFLLYALWPYAKGLLGAIILFVLFKPVYIHLSKKKWCSKGLSAGIIILFTILIIMIPLTFAIKAVVNQASSVVQNQEIVLQATQKIESYISSVDLTSNVKDFLSKTGNFISDALLSTISNITKTIITWIIMYFTLFYMFLNHKLITRKVKDFTPFNKKNTMRLFTEFKRLTTSTIITTGLIALFQGILLGVGFAIFGINGALFWGFIGFIFSLLPLVGIAVVWVPASLYQLFAVGDLVSGIGLIIWGVLLGLGDYFARPQLQKRFGEIHPVVTLVGVFIGLPLFGILGLILGPLLLSYASLLTQMYLQEYAS
ncbi:MAG: AI-2E family transporter [Nanobdellota archaeon]